MEIELSNNGVQQKTCVKSVEKEVEPELLITLMNIFNIFFRVTMIVWTVTATIRRMEKIRRKEDTFSLL